MTRRTVVFLTALMLAGVVTFPAVARSKPVVDRSAIVFLLDGASFEELVSIPEVRGLAGEGGAALLSARTPLREALAGAGDLPMSVFLLGEVPDGPGRDTALSAVGDAIADVLARIPTEQSALVIVATASPSEAMRQRKDDLLGIVVAEGEATSLVAAAAGPPPAPGDLAALTSSSTRRDGVVVSTDVLPTIRRAVTPFKGLDDAPVIKFTTAPAPFELHERYLANRRMSVPVQTAAGIYLALAGLFAVGVLRSRRTGPLRRFAAWAAFSTIPLTAALLLVGHVSSIAYGTVVPAVVAVTLGATFAFDRVERSHGPILTLGLAGVTVLALFVLESALGWTAALTPFLGGSELDGGRFFGLPNVFIGLLMGASLYVAATIARPLRGALVVTAAALFAGLPWTGSNLGGAVAIFAAAGLWYGIRTSGRLGVRAAAWAGAAAVLGAVAILTAHRFLASSPTHLTRFVEGESGGVVSNVADRLGVGFDLIARNPFALIPVVGVPVCLLVVLRPPAVLRTAFARQPAWRDAMLTIFVGSVVAYVANDSGAAALGLGFATGLVGILYVSLLDPPEMMAP